MKELIQQHKEICLEIEIAVKNFNDKHREAKHIKQDVIVPLTEKLKVLESKMYKK
jgi:hypothetical protein